MNTLTLIQVCGVCAYPREIPQVRMQLLSESQSQEAQSDPLLFISFKQHCFVLGVHADPAACKLVSFFVTVDEG